MENEIRYQQALEHFEQEKYEEAVRLFIELYDDGYEREAILQILYDCFVTPNEAEFEKNYQANCEELCRSDYGELTLDFIPVSDTRYYIFHRGLKQFFGYIDISDEEVLAQEAEVHSVLIADVWDLRDMLPYIRMRGWNTCYILLGENRNEFLSFLKLPDIQQKYLYNSMLFFDIDVMKQFFIEYPEYYIPKEIVSGNAAKYREILYELHGKRLEDTKSERKNILLSVCIPSYGRGSVCLKNVQNTLQVEYDSEIEIVVSNNGSTEDTEGYEIIKNMRDSRVTYYEFEENQGYASNILKVLELAKGRFIVFSSDEDFMLIENLHAYMNYLINHSEDGVIRTSGIGPSFGSPVAQKYEKGVKAFLHAINCNYLTGTTLNSFWVNLNNVQERIRQNSENLFVKIYTHSALAFLTVEQTSVSASDIVLWRNVNELNSVEENGREILSYMHYDSRIEQQNAAVEFIEKSMCLTQEELINLIMERISKTYYLCKFAYAYRTEAYKKLIDWRELCTKLHKNNERLIKRLKEYLPEEIVTYMNNDILKTFFNYIAENPMRTMLSPDEQADYKMVEEIAKFLYAQGRPVSEIDYPELEKKWREFKKII